MKLAWCWRCKKDVPMIEEAEWQAAYHLVMTFFIRGNL